jgi:hypothetical protein
MNKEARAKYAREWHAKHPEKSHEYYLKSVSSEAKREKKRQHDREWYASHLEQRKEAQRTYYARKTKNKVKRRWHRVTPLAQETAA